MSARPRNPNGTFKSAFFAEIDCQEAEWHAEIKAKMESGMSFDEAWIAAGGEVIPTDTASRESVEETRQAYRKVGREMPRIAP